MQDPQTDQSVDFLVVGGGAAGFFAAIRAAELAPQLRIAILEGSSQPLSKVRISGGGRCNLTHACFDPRELVQHYPRGQRELLGPFHHFAPGDTIDWFEQRGVATKVEEDGRMFPVSDSSESIAGCLEAAARKAGVPVLLRTRVTQIEPVAQGYRLGTASGQTFAASKVLIATGGQPAMWRILAQLGLHIIAPVPSLFTFHLDKRSLHKLAGISVPAATIGLMDSSLSSSGPLLLTHEGLSGPAVLKLSAWAAREFHDRQYVAELRLNWISQPEEQVLDALGSLRQQEGKRQVTHRGYFELPLRLWRWLLGQAGVPADRKWAELRQSEQQALARALSATPLRMTGKSTFKEEFVTAGGVALEEIHFKTFAAKRFPGLYLAGEVLNIDAVTGGFNFQAAWTGGWLAGTAAAQT